eukprot:SAG11_NODE_125_length_15744_cov_50.316075_2_plen_209_part_00
MRMLLASALCLGYASAGPSLDLAVTSHGSFTIALDGKPWLTGGETMVGGHSSSAKTLVPGAPKASTGTDKLGGYKATSLEWSASSGEYAGSALMTTTFYTYPSDPSTIVFEQTFPAGLRDPAPEATGAYHALRDSSSGRDSIQLAAGKPSPKGLAASTIFPGFSRASPAGDLGCFSYHGVFPQMEVDLCCIILFQLRSFCLAAQSPTQ